MNRALPDTVGGESATPPQTASPKLSSIGRSHRSTAAAGLLRTPEAAKYVGLSASMLCKHRVFGTGPTFLKIGKPVFYDVRDLDAWLAQHRRSSTSTYASAPNPRAAPPEMEP